MSVSQEAAYFEWFSTVVKHAESDLNSPCAVKIPGLWKVKGKSNQYVNRGSVNHTFPGRLCQDQLCIHHSLHDVRVQLKKEIKDRPDTNRHTQNMRWWRGSWYLICEKRKTVWPSLWSLTAPQSYLLPCQYFTTAHPGLLVCPSSPSRCSPSEGVKGWQVPGGAARSLGVRFLRGQAVTVFGLNELGGGDNMASVQSRR